MTKLKASLDTGTYVEPSKKTLAEYAPEALERRRVTGAGLKPTTAATYARYVRQDIVPSRLGEMRLTDIRRTHINAWVDDLTKAGRGAVTVRRALATLQMIISAAVRDEIIPVNPARMIDKPKVSDSDSSVKVWEPEHVGEFFERCGRHRLGALFELAAYTGLRRGEITGLHWADVDLVGRQIDVRHNRVSVDGRVQETTTKTRSGRRTVPLSDAAVAAEDGRALDPAYVTRLFQKLRTQGESLPELTFHGLRHSYASLMIAGPDLNRRPLDPQIGRPPLTSVNHLSLVSIVDR